EDFYLTLATDHLIRLDPSIEQVQEPDQRPSSKPSFCFSFSSSSIPFEPVRPIETQPKIPTLSHGLSRVLFNPGVHWLQDPRTNVYNFDHRLQTLVSPEEFDFESLNPYVTSSRDEQLIGLANENGRRFCGSTSSMTQTLSQIYLMLNGSRPLNVGMLTSSAVSSKKKVELTPGAKMAASIRLKYDDRSQKYSIDSDKSFEVDEQCPDSTILSNLGQILEKFFVLDHDRFKRLLKSHKNSEVEDDDKIQKKRETYAFAKTNLIMTRSQLDCFNDYLPGNGTFDIKTRATIAIRHDRLNHANAAGYHIRSSQGPLESFEREYLDLIRSAFLKYQFQARIGQMDGCFVAYHNTQRVFGFEYIPISKMDQAIFGTTEEADKVFRLCLGYMERILEDSTKLYPEQSLRITTFSKNQGKMWVFVSPDDDQRLTQDPPRDYKVLEYQNYNYLNGVLVEDQNPIDLKSMDERYFDGEERRRADWSVYSQVWRNDRNEELDKLYRSIRKTQFAISQLVLPEGVDRQLLDVVLDWPSFSKQGSKMVNRPEKSQNEEASIPSAESDSEDVDDDMSVNKKAWKVSDSYQGFRPTPGVKYRTGTSDLVKKLRSIAKDGWNIQKDLIDAQKGQKVITIAPVEYLVEDWDKQKKS
ncbi:mitochondrial protein Pet127-domain-containing protein, partial [Phakopsora pachyrhizi]